MNFTEAEAPIKWPDAIYGTRTHAPAVGRPAGAPEHTPRLGVAAMEDAEWTTL